MPRSVPKIAIFEEAARTLDIPGGTKMIQGYYRQMRKFGCNILAVVQQYDIVKNSSAGAMTSVTPKCFQPLDFLICLTSALFVALAPISRWNSSAISKFAPNIAHRF